MGWFSNKSSVASGDGALYRFPGGVGDPDASVGGGYGSQPDTLHRRVALGSNVGLLAFRAFHYGERRLPGRVYEAYQPPLSFSGWLR